MGWGYLCPECDVEEHLSEAEWAEVDAILTRWGIMALAYSRHRPCPRCGAPQTCQTRNAAVESKTWVTPERTSDGEAERLRSLLSRCRLKDLGNTW